MAEGRVEGREELRGDQGRPEGRGLLKAGQSWAGLRVGQG
jgi:hypothetical protein